MNALKVLCAQLTRNLFAIAKFVLFLNNTRRLFGNFATADFRQICPWNVHHGWNADFGDKFMKSFLSGVIYPKTPNLEGWNRHLTQNRLQLKGCTAEKYCLLRVVVQGPGSFRGGVNFFVRCMVAELRGVKINQFSDFGLFSPYKAFKNVPASDQPTAQGLHRRMIAIFPCGSQRSKGMPSGSGVFLQLLVGELGTPKVAQIFAYGKWLYPYRMLLRGLSDLDQRCLKMLNSKDGCTFPPNIFTPTPKTPFWGPFNAKPIIEIALHISCTLMQLRCWNFSYIGIGKYLRVCQYFSTRGPLM